MTTSLSQRALVVSLSLLLSCSWFGSVANADIRMLTGRRELGQKERLVATEVQVARRDISEGRMAGGNPPLVPSGGLIGDDDASLLYVDPLGSGSFFLDGTGGLGLSSDTVGHLEGTLQLEGTNALPNYVAYDVDMLTSVHFSTTGAGYIDFQFDVFNPSLSDLPFLVSLSRSADGTGGGTYVLNPMSGTDQFTIPFDGAGEFDLMIEFHLNNYIVPEGNSSAGFEAYNLSWQIVPEPKSMALLISGVIGLFACRVIRSFGSRNRRISLNLNG